MAKVINMDALDFYAYESTVQSLERDAQQARLAAKQSRSEWVGDILQAAGLPRTIALEEAVFLLSKRSVELSVPDDHELISTEKLEILMAQAEAYKAMCEASKVYVDPQVFNDACNTYYDPDGVDGTFCVELSASANKLDLHEIPLVEFVWADYEC